MQTDIEYKYELWLLIGVGNNLCWLATQLRGELHSCIACPIVSYRQLIS